jgi:hypothetical protein
MSNLSCNLSIHYVRSIQVLHFEEDAWDRKSDLLMISRIGFFLVNVVHRQ